MEQQFSQTSEHPVFSHSSAAEQYRMRAILNTETPKPFRQNNVYGYVIGQFDLEFQRRNGNAEWGSSLTYDRYDGETSLGKVMEHFKLDTSNIYLANNMVWVIQDVVDQFIDNLPGSNSRKGNWIEFDNLPFSYPYNPAAAA